MVGLLQCDSNVPNRCRLLVAGPMSRKVLAELAPTKIFQVQMDDKQSPVRRDESNCENTMWSTKLSGSDESSSDCEEEVSDSDCPELETVMERSEGPPVVEVRPVRKRWYPKKKNRGKKPVALDGLPPVPTPTVAKSVDTPMEDASGVGKGGEIPPVPIVTFREGPAGRSDMAVPTGNESWGEDYAKSPFWKKFWDATGGGEWPKDIRLQAGRMLWDGKICIPESRVDEVIRSHHSTLGHPGVRKMVRELSRRFAFPPSLKLNEAVGEDRRRCLTCQACD